MNLTKLFILLAMCTSWASANFNENVICGTNKLVFSSIQDSKTDLDKLDDFLIILKTDNQRYFQCKEKSLINLWEDAEKSFNNNLRIYAAIIGFLVISFICFKCKKPIMYWLYAHRLCLLCIPSRPNDSSKEFDAYIQFSPNEPSLIWEYVREFENGRRKFKFCYWNNEDSQESILNSMIASKEIIILMTKDYLESEHCRINFYLALQATSMDRHKQMIVIIYPDVGNIEDWGKLMKGFLDLCTCIERDDSNFWNKLLFTLPHQTKYDDDKLKEVALSVEENIV